MMYDSLKARFSGLSYGDKLFVIVKFNKMNNTADIREASFISLKTDEMTDEPTIAVNWDNNDGDRYVLAENITGNRSIEMKVFRDLNELILFCYAIAFKHKCTNFRIDKGTHNTVNIISEASANELKNYYISFLAMYPDLAL